jgi:hypothetical protein
MTYFIFNKNGDNVEGTLSKIAENTNDLNNLNITQSVYKIIEDTLENFNLVKFEKKNAISYNGNTINFIDSVNFNYNKIDLENHINMFKENIQNFLNQNPNHPDKIKWSNYLSQLTNFDLNSLSYPFEKSLVEHFNDIGQPSLNILQLP